jgi:hypothetical protein
MVESKGILDLAKEVASRFCAGKDFTGWRGRYWARELLRKGDKSEAV